MWLSLRITTREPEKYIEFIRRESMQFLVVMHKEGMERQHIHCNIVYRNSESKFRRDLQKAFPELSGNKCFQLKPQLLENIEPLGKMDIYPYSSEYKILAKVGTRYTDEYIEQCILKSIPKTEMKSSSSRSGGFMQTMYEEFMKLNGEERRIWSISEKLRVYNHVMSSLAEKVKILDPIIVKRMVNGLANAVYHHEFKRQFMKAVFDEYELEVLDRGLL